MAQSFREKVLGPCLGFPFFLGTLTFFIVTRGNARRVGARVVIGLPSWIGVGFTPARQPWLDRDLRGWGLSRGSGGEWFALLAPFPPVPQHQVEQEEVRVFSWLSNWGFAGTSGTLALVSSGRGQCMVGGDSHVN